MKSYLSLIFAVISLPTIANTITTPTKPIVAIDASEMNKRVCYYQDLAYSDGAILQVGEHYMVCSAANSFETNGVLKWNPLDEQATQETETKANTKAVKRHSTN